MSEEQPAINRAVTTTTADLAAMAEIPLTPPPNEPTPSLPNTTEIPTETATLSTPAAATTAPTTPLQQQPPPPPQQQQRSPSPIPQRRVAQSPLAAVSTSLPATPMDKLRPAKDEIQHTTTTAVTTAATNSKKVSQFGGSQPDGPNQQSDGTEGSSSGLSSSSVAWSDQYNSSFWASSVSTAQRVSYYVSNSPPPPAWFSVLAVVIEVVQLAVVSLGAPFARYFSVEGAACESNRWRWGALLLRVLRDPSPASEEARFIASCAVLGLWSVHFVAFMVEFVAMKRGSLPHKGVLSALRWTAIVERFALMPSASLFLATAMHRNGGVGGCSAVPGVTLPYNSALVISISSVGLICAVLFSLYSVAMHTEFVPSSSMTAQVNCRIALALFLFKVAVVFLDLLRANALSMFIVMALAAIVTALYWVFLPYYWNLFNYVAMCTLSVVTWTSFMAFVGALTTTSASLAVLIVSCVGCVGAGALAWFVTMVRVRQYTRKLMDETPSLKQPFMVELTARQCFYHPNDRTLTEKAIVVISRGKEQFPDSPTLHIAHGLILLEYKHDPRGMLVHMKTAKRLEHMADLGFIINSLMQTAIDYCKSEGRSKEIDDLLEIALRHQKLAKQDSARFWLLLSKLPKGVSFDLPETFVLTGRIDGHMEKSLSIMKELLRKYPTNCRILRAYARLMDEVANDTETAQQAFNLADQVEEEATRKIKKKSQKAAVTMAAEIVEVCKQELPLAIEAKRLDGEVEGYAESVVSSSMVSASTSLASEETMRARFYRKHLDNVKLRSEAILHAGVVFALLVVFACSIIEYQLTQSFLSTYTQTLDVMHSTVGARSDLYNALYFARLRETDLLVNATGSDPTAECVSLKNKTDGFADTFVELFKINTITPEVHDLWTEKRLVSGYIPGSTAEYSAGSRFNYTAGLFDIGQSTVNCLNALCSSKANLPGGAYRTDSDFRFTIDNGASVLSAELAKLTGFLNSMITSTLDTNMQILLVVFLVGAALSLVLYFGLLVGAVRVIAKERARAATLFHEIPKSSLANILEKLDADNLHDSSAKHGKSISNVRVFSLELLLGLCLVLADIAALYIVAANFTSGYGKIGASLESAGTRRNLLTASRYWMQELTVKDPTFHTVTEIKAELDSVLEQFKKTDEDLKYGNDTLGLKSLIKSNAKLEELWYVRPCPENLKISDCRGVSTLIRRYMDDAFFFASASNTDPSNEHYQYALSIAVDLANWLQEGLVYLREIPDGPLRLASVVTQVLLATSVVLTIVVYLWLQRSLRNLARESERLIKMLLQLPVQILEGADTIKEFVESGSSLADVRNENSKVQSQEHQTKDILEACEDAVIVCDKRATIEIVNPATERITGYVAAELLGTNLSVILPEAVGSNRKLHHKIHSTKEGHLKDKAKSSQEVVICAKDGRQFTSLAAMSKSMVGQKATYTLFVRDITALKEHEKEILRQHNRAEALLCNILPRALVTQMAQQSEGESAERKSTVIAQSYEEATVLFADIVGFTPLSSGMTPEELVLLLHTLFSEWDKIAMELGIEKIKTIGDCYLACAGIPTPYPEHAESMLEFAIAMLGKLRDYNKAHKTTISMRVGINTGPLVAGVLGQMKMAYDIWGDTVTVAARMENSGFPDRIQVSENTYAKLKGRGYQFQSRGKVTVKGHNDIEGWLYDQEAPDIPRRRIGKSKLRESDSAFSGSAQGFR